MVETPIVKQKSIRLPWVAFSVSILFLVAAVVLLFVFVLRGRSIQRDLEREQARVDQLTKDLSSAGSSVLSVSPTPSPTPRQSLTPTPSPTPTLTPTPSVVPQQTLFTDIAKYYSMSLPASWVTVSNEGAIGVQKSRASFDTPNFSSHTDESFEGPFTPIYYDTGATFSVHVTQGEGSLFVPSDPVFSKRVTVDGVSAMMYAYREPSTFSGQILEVNLNYGGNQYLFRMGYNPDSFSEGQVLFEQVLASVRFL